MSMLNSKLIDKRLSAMTIAPLFTFFLKFPQPLVLFDVRDVKLIIPSFNAELKKGFDFIYSETA